MYPTALSMMMYAEYPSQEVPLPWQARKTNARVWLSRMTRTGMPSPASASYEFMNSKSALTAWTPGDSPVASACFFPSALAWTQ